MTKRVKADDPIAIYTIGGYYLLGANGLPQDYKKALESYHQAAKLGYVKAYHQIGCMYDIGDGVKQDIKKAIHYYELAIIRGNALTRYNLGAIEERAGNKDRAIKHYMIAVGGGHYGSLESIKRLYMRREATKDDYSKALISYQEYLNEIKSDQRDEAAAIKDCKYID